MRRILEKRQKEEPATAAGELAAPREAHDSRSAANPGQMTHPNTPATWSGKDRMIAMLLIASLLLAYHPAWHGQPIWDDDAHLTQPMLCSWLGLGRIWFDLGATQQYYPVTHSVFWLQHRLWGDWYTGYHFINILLHGVAALLLLQILRRLRIHGAWMVVALWALHPVQVESVAWMSELKNTLSGVFYLGAALVYLRFDCERSRKTYWVALGLFVLGLWTKSVIATLPAALLLLFYWKQERLDWRKDVRPLIPFFIVGAASGLFTTWVERTLIGADGGDFNFNLLERFLIAGRAFWFYPARLIWPADLMFIYPRWKIGASTEWQFLFPALALGMIALLIGMRKRWGKGLPVAVLYFTITLFPALGFLNIYPFRYSFVADHFQYLACIAPVVLLVMGAIRAFDSWPGKARLVKPAFGATLLVALGLLTWKQCHMYSNLETLWETTLARNPECWMAYNNLGNVRLNQGRTEQAIVLFRESLRINPNNAKAQRNLGLAFFRQGRVEEAISHYYEALRINPAYANARLDLGNALLQQGRTEEAITLYNEALRINPAYAEAHINLGNALLQQGRTEEDISHTQKALELQPDNPAFQNNLAWLLATAPQASARDGARAVRLATQACQSTGGKNPLFLYTLAAAYAETGEFSQAVQTAQIALHLTGTGSHTQLADSLRKEINLYETGHRFEPNP